MASHVTFGSSTGPCRARAGSPSQPHQPEEPGEKGNCDPERLLQCPFDKSHQIRACRFPYHLMKCKKNHPELARELKTCPFNARHLMPREELARHTETCEDRISVSADEAGAANGERPWHVPVSTWVNPNVTEDWENEADANADAFVWNPNKVPEENLEVKNIPGLPYRPPRISRGDFPFF